MTDCNGCGSCCDPVVLSGQSLLNRDRALTPQSDQLREMLVPIRAAAGGGVAYECIHFDKHERRCTNYEGRPQMCRGFPWYGKDPTDDGRISNGCSFQADLGRTVLLIVAVT